MEMQPQTIVKFQTRFLQLIAYLRKKVSVHRNSISKVLKNNKLFNSK